MVASATRRRCSRRATADSLVLAGDHEVRSIAFPAISTGAYGFPIDLAAEIAMREISRFLAGNTLPERVIGCCFSDRDLATYRNVATRMFS